MTDSTDTVTDTATDPAGAPLPALRIAFSPCPNDTFVFHAWVHGLVPELVEQRLREKGLTRKA